MASRLTTSNAIAAWSLCQFRNYWEFSQGFFICIITFAYRTPVICQADRPKEHSPLFLYRTDSIQEQMLPSRGVSSLEMQLLQIVVQLLTSTGTSARVVRAKVFIPTPVFYHLWPLIRSNQPVPPQPRLPSNSRTGQMQDLPHNRGRPGVAGNPYPQLWREVDQTTIAPSSCLS